MMMDVHPAAAPFSVGEYPDSVWYQLPWATPNLNKQDLQIQLH